MDDHDEFADEEELLVDEELPVEERQFHDAEAPADRLKGLVQYLAGNLIDDPDAVEVDVQQRGPSVHLTLRVPDDELGKVIGRQGRIARALRTALSIAGARSDVRATLDIEG